MQGTFTTRVTQNSVLTPSWRHLNYSSTDTALPSSSLEDSLGRHTSGGIGAAGTAGQVGTNTLHRAGQLEVVPDQLHALSIHELVR